MKGSPWVAVVGAFVVAACIEPKTIAQCGDRICPAGQVCFANAVAGNGELGACVDREMVDACAATVDGDPCAVTGPQGFDGLCRDGVCQLPSCGDGFARDPEPCEGADLRGTTCEDLGRYPGALTCTSICTFDRSQCGGYCGNGAREELEECEGSDLTALQCGDFGRYRGDLTCNTNCQFDLSGCSGTCGDGVVDSSDGELCESGVLGATTCRDLGRYRGTLACGAACQYDITGCSGRCGDGVIDGDEGEACDSAVPQGTCVTFGYDIGRLACAGCQRSFTGCGQFGFEPRAEVQWATSSYRGYSNGVIAALEQGNVVLIDNGVASIENLGASELAVAGHDGVIVALTKSRTRRYRNGMWETLPAIDAQIGFTDYIGDVDVDAAGNIYAVTLSCEVVIYRASTQQWAAIQTPPSNSPRNCRLIRGLALDDVWVGGVHWDDDAWDVQGSYTADLAVAGTTVYAATERGIERVTRTTNVVVIPANPFELTAVETVGNAVCGIGSGSIRCLVGGVLREQPASGINLLHGDGRTLTFYDNGTISTADVGVFEEFAGTTSTVRAVSTTGVDDATAILRFNTATGNSELEIDAGTTARFTQQVATALLGIVPLAGGWVTLGDFESFFWVGRTGTIDYAPLAGQIYLNDVAMAMWGDGAGFVAAAFELGSVAFYDMAPTGDPLDPIALSAQVITTLPVPSSMACTPKRMTGRARNDLFVLANCTLFGQSAIYDVIFRFNGVAWTLWYQAETFMPGDDFFAIPGDDRLLLARNYNGFHVEWIRDGVVVRDDDTNVGPHIMGTSATDLFAYGNVDLALRPLVGRFDGTAWTPVRLPATTSTRAAVATPTMLTFAGTERSLRLMRMRTTP